MDKTVLHFPPSFVICSEKEQITNEGEDSFAYSVNNQAVGYIAAFDGCGGMGAKKYPNVGDRSGAKIASMVAAYLTDQFYEKHSFHFDDKDTDCLRKLLANKLQEVKAGIAIPGGLKIGGSMFRELPTTASLVAMKIDDELNLLCEYIWAGDSRGYFLDDMGLCQVTSDDLDTEEDAFSNLRNDAKLSNVVNADTEFQLHHEIRSFSHPVIIITATDGAFGYFNSPMEFEYLLLDTLMTANDLKQWEKNLTDSLIPYAGDDFTIVAAGYGFKNIQDCKSYFSERHHALYRDYIEPMSNANEDEMLQLWSLYRTDYYRR